jgi:hypothetical protein
MGLAGEGPAMTREQRTVATAYLNLGLLIAAIWLGAD